MDSGCRRIGMLFFFTFCLDALVLADASTVFFVDSPTHHYLRHRPSPLQVQHQAVPMSDFEVGAAVSVLLGFLPPPMLSTDSSSKLNDLLMPNPFHRPRHVFILQVGLNGDSEAMLKAHSGVLNGAIKNKVISSSVGMGIELPDSEGITFSSLDRPANDFDRSLTDEQISEFASSFGGSFVANDVGPLKGELIIPLPSGSEMNLHVSKKAHREFTAGMTSMIENIGKVVEVKHDLSGSDSDVAELVGGYFDGIKALQEEHESEDLAQQAMEFLLTTVSRNFASLQSRYKGEIVCIMLFSEANSVQPKNMLDVTFASRVSPRWLGEAKTSSNSTFLAEVALVRTTLAWITGIVLIIATYIGVYLLLNMPLTRDTLLYANVKLD